MAPTNNSAPSEAPFWVQRLATHTALFRPKALALAGGDAQDGLILVESYLKKHSEALRAAVSLPTSSRYTYIKT